MESIDELKRTWNTPIREPWNPVIKQCLDAIDLHVSLYLKTHDKRHMDQAELLRGYVRGVKEWVHEVEMGVKPPLYDTIR